MCFVQGPALQEMSNHYRVHPQLRVLQALSMTWPHFCCGKRAHLSVQEVTDPFSMSPLMVILWRELCCKAHGCRAAHCVAHSPLQLSAAG